MANSFSFRDGAAIPTDLGDALSAQLSRLFRRAPAASQEADRLAGPSFGDLEPDLRDEISRR